MYFDKTNPESIGQKIFERHINHLSGRQIVIAIISGAHAIERVKQIVGDTEPLKALRGTIRGDWCTDSIIHCNIQKRALNNLVHRATNTVEAKHQISTWF
jgi:nucleoside-diphosphate kinase